MTQGIANTKRGNSPYQREAHKRLLAAGFEFTHRGGKSANFYRHPNGATFRVHSTPTNPSSTLKIVDDVIRRSDKGTDMGTTTGIDPTAPLVALADTYLLTKPKLGPRSFVYRSHFAAFEVWVKRCLEKYGPMDPKLLDAAAERIGFSGQQTSRARVNIGAVAYTTTNPGGGKGGNPRFVALAHQVPEGVSLAGRKHEASGVEPVAPDPGDILTEDLNDPQPPLVEAHVPDDAPDPQPAAAPRAIYGKVEIKDGEVAAAAQMLLDSLGIKATDPALITGAITTLQGVANDLRRVADTLSETMKTLARGL